jgi:hypothetical protein
MQDVDALLELCHVEHAMFHAGVEADLVHTRAHGRHGLPITGHQPLLHLTEFVSGGAADGVRKPAQVVKGRPKPVQGLLGYKAIYT